MPTEKEQTSEEVVNTDKPKVKKKPLWRKLAVSLAVIAGFALLVLALARGYQYTVSPAVIREPSVDHYHFRTQLFYSGQPVNFAGEQFQETYIGGQCSADLPETPIHFHDNTDQMTHVHWNGMTGGLFLKYYGLDLIGGPEGKLGWRFDRGPLSPQPVHTHTDVLPEVPDGHDIFVFIKTADGFKEKPFYEFLEQDFETFFEKNSNLGNASNSWLDWIMPKAQAHAGEIHANEAGAGGTDLEQLNNLIGDVAIFVQAERPTDQEVTAAFSNLVELSESTCGG